ncbi:sulfite exporter TauE/SafE family protein [Halalkalicoccus sp. NIPERK01]|uniref:sulfite exporter TauE/SafE family protein n=1 Tax=Halalkalicoccus sp. NIPERK01 TaxID=3053469 RepID=UPI00256EAC8D|nr:sulfite exporter TauE/SafE family protein [Halalkalicoccus sp. NIPERK01]MDL5363147.1 sulfite exporter TauE/SafE family protein [Halalkalicoccus sp. NIPERK01]
MELFGLGIVMIGFFVGFGLLIGILFGFFGMGGSFLVTPALLVLGYPAPVAVGSAFAFVFGTSVIGALRHRDHGQISYTLAAVMILGMTFGIEVGTRVVFVLANLGNADFVISVVYVGLLGAVGLIVLRDTSTDGIDVGTGRVATKVQAITLPPLVSLPGGATVSVWVILVVGSGIGILSGSLGVGGGFLLLPVMVYGFGIPTAIAAGTSILQISVSGVFGTFVYAQSNAVNVSVVAALLGGSALGARIGASATRLVDEADVKGYFAVMLLAGGIATASKQVGVAFGVEMLETMSTRLIFGTAVLVSGAIIYMSIAALRENREHRSPLIRKLPVRLRQ